MAEPGTKTVAPRRPVVAALSYLTLAGGALLAYRLSTPAGNLTLDRVGLALLVVAVAPLILNARISRRAMLWIASQLALVGLAMLGCFQSTQFDQAVIYISGLVLAAALFGVFFTIVRCGRLSRRVASRLPLTAYLPTGLMGLYQAAQLARGQHPSIPFANAFSLTDATANAARTAFGSGLDRFHLDRIAAATGDPPTFGILSALVIVYIAWSYRAVPELKGRLALVSTCIAAAGVVLSQSAAALLTLAAGLATEAFLRSRSLTGPRRPKRRISLFAGTAVFVGLAVVAATDVVQRFLASASGRFETFAEGTGTTSEHLSLINGAWQIFSDNPLLGVGTGDGSSVYFGTATNFSSFHNVLALGLAENGVLAFLIIPFAWLILARYFVPPPLMAAALMAWFTYMDWNRLPFLWGLLAISAALATRDEPARPTPLGEPSGTRAQAPPPRRQFPRSREDETLIARTEGPPTSLPMTRWTVC